MLIINRISDIKAYLREQQKKGKSVGFVPTMGYLHEGHLSLIRNSSSDNDLTVVSIFVNPTQFGPGEDFSRYPRDLERDTALAESAGTHLLFVPNVDEMYPEGYNTYVEVQGLTDILCGSSRPGHFRGVTTVVSKLLNIVYPERAYFGQKDAQQAAVIKRMVKDLNMDTQIIVCPIIREADGLAMSSRNVYLSPEEREQALVLSLSLKMAEDIIFRGENSAAKLKEIIEENIKQKPLANIDYVALVDAETLKDTEIIGGKVLIALAVKFGRTRLIDNTIVEVST